MRTFNHVGILTNENKEGAMFNEGLNVWLFLKFDDPAKSCLPDLVKTNGHLAYTVPSLDEALKGTKVIFGPAVCDEHLTIAFIEEEGIAIELMEIK